MLPSFYVTNQIHVV